MRPNDFILNSDYLSIAQVNSGEYTVTIGAGTLTAQGFTEQNIDQRVQSIAGASDRILISKDGGSFYLGSYRQLEPATNVYGFIHVFRTAVNNLRVQVVLENHSIDTVSYPAMTFTIKISSFKAPNVF